MTIKAPTHSEVYSLPLYMNIFVSDLRKDGSFLGLPYCTKCVPDPRICVPFDVLDSDCHLILTASVA
jgi:hypothetical protein